MTALHVVVMGVSGCGKSEVGQRLSAEMKLPLVEGDSFHPASNIEKMSRGLPLDDADRAGWLKLLAQQLASNPAGAVLTCSALKRAYRDTLRGGVKGLRFVHLALSLEQAQRRVASRPGHFYPPSLVATQFQALESPAGEPGVVTVDATGPLDAVVRDAIAGLREFG
jgi:gluconokinase